MKLEEFLGQKDVREILEKDWVLQSIDTGRQEHAEGVVEALRKGVPAGGIPWMTIVDAKGRRLVTSDAPTGNVGCPVEPEEIAWFRRMLGETKSRCSDAELDRVQELNRAFARRIRGGEKL